MLKPSATIPDDVNKVRPADIKAIAAIAAKTLGGKLHCDPEMLKPSATIPDDVNKVRPADIKAIAAIGDSFIVAARSTNFLDDPPDIFPGNSFISGGDETVEEHITVAKILRIFNPTVMGVSHGAGYGNMGFNVATGGATCKDVIVQAKELIRRMKEGYVNLNEDWKLIWIFIGTNDIGRVGCISDEESTSRDVYKSKLEEGISYLLYNLNRTIISIIPIWNPHLTVDARWLIDKGKRMECGHYSTRNRDVLAEEYRKVAYELQNEKRFDHKNFTVVVQGFMDEIRDAFRKKSGEYDKSFYGSDSFHLSKYGNAVMAKFLWNNLLEPVGNKTTNADLGDDSVPIKCPTMERPYIQTLGNRM
ncbi:GDSL-like protein [Dictyocaulus viviparus]|uniref:GDSL-like protein n=1 Tax=Dictyocaulus viviparus TaxID=29172 RepID=A0A0D8XGS1_DICVI|nr:GDSL-like protein [Dictyocaulus viviparus]